MKNMGVETEYSSEWYKTASDTDRQIFKDWLRGVLTTEEVDLTFKKLDGTIRKMKCTLKESRLPELKQSTNNTPKKQSLESMAVFDLEKQEWRSFRFDSVSEIKFTLGN